MGIRELLLTIQYLCIFALFIMAFIVFRSWKARVHGYLLLSTLACLVNNIGYLFVEIYIPGRISYSVADVLCR